ncbi:hypothetical protein TVAG_262230 [Trichomonas vaginalis G3]|uniref:CLASP N-terminal domain-containing protein n=1 Tax=Trichomonas vaginalis (strain ATCC PRA-98 / G3) TaxID=412133 RepID=A2DUD5_TRIV3|nr:microtubule binding CLASP family [Trichomonas vaginalis G3]EAY15973.1 hypothetical protein TVAG_262230 [Trichomonas vaginalis G3]KAI5523608.1 microtubule binding CLASP family [Trichomonas vaginalis G3]|eukprot:XP_001328196.1 hypothetical protein [Trichomonas vaginalis G3]
MFESPFDLVEEVQIKSASEAAKESELLASLLDEKSEWDSKFNAIKRSMSLIKGGALDYPEFNLNIFVPSIANVVTDLRSTLVKWGALFACALSKVLGVKFSNFTDLFIPNLFKQATHGTAVISQSCHFAIVEIVSNSPSRKTARCILDKASDKSSARRLIVAESLKIMTTSWPKNIYTPLQTDISSAVTKLRKDASSEVRNTFRSSPGQVLQPPSSGTPPSISRLTPKESFRRLSPRIPQISKTPRPSLPAVPSFQATKPHNESEATQFIHQISQQLESTVPASKKRKVKMIQEAFPAAVDLTPYDPTLYTIIPKLLKRYKDETKEVITDILISMELDEKVLKSSISTYTFEGLLELFKRDADALAFVKHVYSTNQELVTENSLKRLKEIQKSNPDDKEFNEIIESLTPHKEYIDELIDKAISNQNYDGIITEAYSSSESTKFMNDINNSDKIPNLFKSEHNLTACELCENLIRKIPTLTFDSSLSFLIKKITNSSLCAPISEKIVHVIMQQGQIHKRFSELLNEPGFLSALANYLPKANSSASTKIYQNLSEILVQQMKSDNLTSRRCSAMCIIYLMKNTGDKSILEKLNENQKLVIKKYSQRLNL